MARPKSDDPKQVVTLRLRASQLAALEALGPGGWRANLEALIDGKPAPKAVVVEAPKVAAIHVSVPTLQRRAFNPQPKTGKR